MHSFPAHAVMTAWLRDDIIRRLARNVVYLLSGSGGAALMSMASLALTARALGPTLLGMLVVIEAYVRLADQLLRLETWQAVIKHGADSLENDKTDDFKRLIKFAVMLDIGTAWFAGAAAAAGVVMFGHLMGWSDETQHMGIIFSLTIFARLSGTPTAVMRLFDKFAVFAWQQILTAGIRLALVTTAYLAGAGLWGFLIIWMTCTVFEQLFMVSLAWRELVRQGHGDALRISARGITKIHPGIWQFMISMNLSVLIRKTTRETDTLIIGGVLGPAAAGLYHVAKRLGDAMLKIGTPIQQAVFPEVAKLWARKEVERFKQTIWRINLATGVACVLVLAVVAPNAELLVRILAGDKFLEAASIVTLQILGVCLIMFGTVIRPALQSMGLHTQLLKIVIVATAAFYAFLLLTVTDLGIASASIAHIVFAVVWLAGTGYVLQKGLKKEGRMD